MGCNARDKHIRTSRRPRSVKSEPDQSNAVERAEAISKSMTESGSLNYPSGLTQNPDSNIYPTPIANSACDDNNGWGYCTEEQLEGILFKHLDFLYNDAVSKLVTMGYAEDIALKAVLKNGHCYGGLDVLTNILHNSLAYLNSGNGGPSDDSEPVFADLRQLVEYSLAGMVCLLQQVKPQLSKGDAMWCLLMSDLHVGRASVMEIPVIPSPSGDGCVDASPGSGNVEGVCSSPPAATCKFNGGWGFGNGAIPEFPMNGFLSYASEMSLSREIECPERFNLTPTMKTMLKRNVAAFAAGFKANLRQMQNQSQASSSSLLTGDSLTGGEKGVEAAVGQSEEPQNLKNQDVVNSVLSKFRDLNLDENAEHAHLDQKDEMILSLTQQIKDLERQVKERKEWAQQKAMQAARKLCHDLTELKVLRMEREETQRVKKGKQTLEDTTMKRLSEMENALRKASGQVDRANAAVRKLETENAEIRAEMEASKLSASESVTTCLEVAKREKKYLKRLLAWEKQKTKLQEDIAAEKQKIIEWQQELVQVETAQKDAEAKWKEEQKAKEQASALVEEERRLKEAAETNNKRKLEALRSKIEIDFQRHKDDLQRLEQELSRLKASAQSTNPHHQSTNATARHSNGVSAQGDIARLLHGLELEGSQENDVTSERLCLICKKEEVSVVFLPCLHQVVCVNCNDNYGKKGRALCPCCRVPIEQRIRVFGASSK